MKTCFICIALLICYFSISVSAQATSVFHVDDKCNQAYGYLALSGCTATGSKSTIISCTADSRTATTYNESTTCTGNVESTTTRSLNKDCTNRITEQCGVPSFGDKTLVRFAATMGDSCVEGNTLDMVALPKTCVQTDPGQSVYFECTENAVLVRSYNNTATCSGTPSTVTSVNNNYCDRIPGLGDLKARFVECSASDASKSAQMMLSVAAVVAFIATMMM